MGRLLYSNPSARGFLQEASEFLGYDLGALCLRGPLELLTRASRCQVALYVHGTICVELLRQRGFLKQVEASAGLSLGELTALRAVGVFDFKSGLEMVHKRATLMEQACENTQGSMLSLLGGTLRSAKRLAVRHQVDIANLNCPGQIVLAGHLANIKAVQQAASEEGFKRCVPLRVAGAYHSGLMSQAAEEFAKFLDKQTFHPPTCPVFCNIDGLGQTDPSILKKNLVAQIQGTVNWQGSFQNMLKKGIKKFYECGPSQVLKGLGKRMDKTAEIQEAESLLFPN